MFVSILSRLTMSESEKIVRVVKFTKAAHWLNWKEVFLATVGMKDTKMSLVFDLEEDFPLVKMENGREVEIAENVEAMKEAYQMLLLSMDYNTKDGKAAFALVKNSKDKNKRGNARLAFERLCNRFDPKTSLKRSIWVEELFSKKCGPQENPEDFLFDMEALLNKIHEVDEGELVIDHTTFVHQVLNALPKEYETMVKIIREKLRNEGKDAVDISYLSSEFSQKYEKQPLMKISRKGERMKWHSLVLAINPREDAIFVEKLGIKLWIAMTRRKGQERQ